MRLKWNWNDDEWQWWCPACYLRRAYLWWREWVR